MNKTNTLGAIADLLAGGGAGTDIRGQFRPEEAQKCSVARNLNAAFMIALAGDGDDDYKRAVAYMEETGSDPLWAHLTGFYAMCLEELPREFARLAGNKEKVRALNTLSAKIRDGGACAEDMWALFCPDASEAAEDRKAHEEKLRRKRRVTVTSLNREPLTDAARQVLFTSNALLTIPPEGRSFDELDLTPSLAKSLAGVVREVQLFWYDHPVQLGVEPEKNEILYGLKHLSETLAYEKKHSGTAADAELTCLLSASVTHEGLQGLAKEYIEYELKKSHDLPGLKVHLFTEADTAALVRDVLAPAAKKYLDETGDAAALLREVVGVDGKYGRHYSFLKAAAALWHVLIDSEIKATFKTDLDQVFPQELLKAETGKSAFEHLLTPLWGADGVDSEGRPVHLGMLAGALVNSTDIDDGLFTPDVKYPEPPYRGEDFLFLSRVPQALSTSAEMMTRYGTDGLDGKGECISRIHVTGGTNGITVGALRRYRPFTPVFINRAEDQAYLMSALFNGESGNGGDGDGRALRYGHAAGLIMRHDKESFAREAIAAAATGKIIGDYERIIFFSEYARSLPWSFRDVKDALSPFTGSFISEIPGTTAVLRLVLKAAEFFDTCTDDDQKTIELLEVGSRRLTAAMRETAEVKEKYERERRAWHIYYDTLDALEKALKEGDDFAEGLRDRAREIVAETKVRIPS